MKKSLIFSLILVFSLFAYQSSLAQDALEPKASPTDIAKATLKDTYIKVTYARPHKKGRVVFGELVPFGKVWRLGANDATEITITKDVKMAGNAVAAGTYTMFCIPEADKWTIILNKELGQWGAYRYSEKADLLRFTVPVAKSDKVYEPFTIKLDAKGTEANMSIIWDETQVNIPISVE